MARVYLYLQLLIAAHLSRWHRFSFRGPLDPNLTLSPPLWYLPSRRMVNIHLYGRRGSHAGLARSRAFEVLRRGISRGHLIIEDDGEHEFGYPENATVIVKVKSPNMWIRILLSYDIGCKLPHSFPTPRISRSLILQSVSEAYMHGDFEVSDLRGLLNVVFFFFALVASAYPD
jgi:hypothetical protein